MRTIAHLSDLHFGTEDPRIVDGLLADLHARRPSVVAVSGDLTQRAREVQYRAARAFLDRLPAPALVVPGNHDIPLWDVAARLTAPFDRFRRWIGADLDPTFLDDELVLLGVNTVRRTTFQSGRVSVEQIAGLAERLARLGERRVAVVVTHHPLVRGPRDGTQVAGRSARTLDALERSQVDLLLSGHLHGSWVARHPLPAGGSVLVAHGGTATSSRLRGEPNAFHWIAAEPDRIEVTRRVWTGERFAAAGAPVVWRRRARGEWTEAA